MPQNAFFFYELAIFWSAKKRRRHFLSTLHPLSTVIFATARVLAFVLLRDSRFNFHCYTQREATPTQKPARKLRCDLSRRLLARKITKRIHSSKPASLNRPILTTAEVAGVGSIFLWAGAHGAEAEGVVIVTAQQEALGTSHPPLQRHCHSLLIRIQ